MNWLIWQKHKVKNDKTLYFSDLHFRTSQINDLKRYVQVENQDTQIRSLKQSNI